jgi:hypothetical protein
VLEGAVGAPVDDVAITFSVVLNAALGDVQDAKAADAGLIGDRPGAYRGQTTST